MGNMMTTSSSWERVEAAAYSMLPYTSRAMIEYGSEDDETVRNNAGAWSKYALVP